MRTAEFFVPGNPKGQPRPRAFSRGGKTRVYDPGTAEGWKGQIALVARDYLPPAPIELPVVIHLRFSFRRPSWHYGKQGLKPTAPMDHATKPDADNLAKAVIDALVEIGFLRDDCIVWFLFVTKRYTDRSPGCAIRIAW